AGLAVDAGEALAWGEVSGVAGGSVSGEGEALASGEADTNGDDAPGAGDNAPGAGVEVGVGGDGDAVAGGGGAGGDEGDRDATGAAFAASNGVGIPPFCIEEVSSCRSQAVRPAMNGTVKTAVSSLAGPGIFHAGLAGRRR
ncbi:MAG: hypothetical protein JO069_05980, partial [Verrucomicrobia bacterium]|nr:hypothetical protein [Verrucomicrobiota bacterium]